MRRGIKHYQRSVTITVEWMCSVQRSWQCVGVTQSGWDDTVAHILAASSVISGRMCVAEHVCDSSSCGWLEWRAGPSSEPSPVWQKSKVRVGIRQCDNWTFASWVRLAAVCYEMWSDTYILQKTIHTSNERAAMWCKQPMFRSAVFRITVHDNPTLCNCRVNSEILRLERVHNTLYSIEPDSLCHVGGAG